MLRSNAMEIRDNKQFRVLEFEPANRSLLDPKQLGEMKQRGLDYLEEQKERDAKKNWALPMWECDSAKTTSTKTWRTRVGGLGILYHQEDKQIVGREDRESKSMDMCTVYPPAVLPARLTIETANGPK
jgi:hypothetical protein